MSSVMTEIHTTTVRHRLFGDTASPTAMRFTDSPAG